MVCSGSSSCSSGKQKEFLSVYIRNILGKNFLVKNKSQSYPNLFISLTFWIMAIFLYVAAAAPLIPVLKSEAHLLSSISFLPIILGILLFRSKIALNAVKTSSLVQSVKEERFIRLSTWAAFLAMFFTIVIYLINAEAEKKMVPPNFIITPFALFFFYAGRWCMFRPGSRLT